jgi:hypothetical protein
METVSVCEIGKCWLVASWVIICSCLLSYHKVVLGGVMVIVLAI